MWASSLCIEVIKLKREFSKSVRFEIGSITHALSYCNASLKFYWELQLARENANCVKPVLTRIRLIFVIYW